MFEVIKYIHDNLDKKLFISDIAKKFGYSKWYFCSLFKKYTGLSFNEYIKYYRMQFAVIDIDKGIKIIDIATKYGYDTPSGFNKAFLSEFGCLPRSLKESNKNCRTNYKKRKERMFTLSDRCVILKDNTVNKKVLNPLISVQRQVLFDEGVASCTIYDNHIIMASGISNVIKKSLPVIGEGELIVGYNYADKVVMNCAINSGENIILKDDEISRNIIESNKFTKMQADSFFVNRPDLYKNYFNAPYPVYSQQELELREEWAAIGRCIADNHSVLGYDLILKYGFEGMLEKINELERINGKSYFYDSIKMICESACEFGERYASEAKEILKGKDLTIERRLELAEIIKVCSVVPKKPATTFWEAVQSLWFAHIINTWEDGINANSLGRIDQILYPYYKQDVDNNRITKEYAFEIICCLWLKLYREYDVQQSCIGGCKADGSSAVNELSYMMLDATECLDLIRCMSVRYSSKTEKAFLKRALEVTGHVQKGVPFFFNDDVMIEALTIKGISLKDARDYTQIGCVETVIPGKSNPHAVTGETNLLKALEYALNNGVSMFDETKSPGIKTGILNQFTNFEKLKKAVFEQIRWILEVTCKKVCEHTKAASVTRVKPYKSLLTKGCLESNKDFNNFGSLYDYYQIMLGGIPNLADSLMVLKQYVYDNSKYTLEQIVEQLKNDYKNELMRLEFLNKSPKFGNDISEVDDIAVEITNFACDVLDELSVKYAMSFHAELFTFIWMIDHGNVCAASPDGRHKGEIIAYSASPMQGRDFCGLTSLLNSLSKLPTKRTPGTTSAIVEVSPDLFTDSNIESIADMLLAAAENGISNIQFNTINVETLINAQKYPDKYNNLAVRVSGFSQKFNLLSRDLQNHIIGRTKHKCL